MWKVKKSKANKHTVEISRNDVVSRSNKHDDIRI